MAYARTRRVGEEIRKIVSAMLFEGQIKDSKIKNSNSLISVTSVDVVRDLRYAYVYVSVLGNDAGSVIEGLKNAAGYVRKEVGRELNIRYTPEIVFRLDDSIEKGAYMSKLIRELNPSSDEMPEGDPEEEI
ncbi:MAG: 30S ribosome-binding factor RbfA [Peptostreptococcaceae bacterium]|nr:30S ribosome-binding factor RbfA [Peptostreptococcaceae bacterium]